MLTEMVIYRNCFHIKHPHINTFQLVRQNAEDKRSLPMYSDSHKKRRLADAYSYSIARFYLTVKRFI